MILPTLKKLNELYFEERFLPTLQSAEFRSVEVMKEKRRAIIVGKHKSQQLQSLSTTLKKIFSI